MPRADSTIRARNGTADQATFRYPCQVVILITRTPRLIIEPRPATTNSAATTCAVQQQVSAVQYVVPKIYWQHTTF